MSRSVPVVLGLLVASLLAWNLAAQEGGFGGPPPVFDQGGDFAGPGFDEGTEPADPNATARRTLIELNTKLVQQLSADEVQQEIDAVTRKLRNREAETKLERARAILQEIVRDAPGTPAAVRAERGLSAMSSRIPAGGTFDGGFTDPVPDSNVPAYNDDGFRDSPLNGFDSNSFPSSGTTPFRRTPEPVAPTNEGDAGSGTFDGGRTSRSS